MAKKRKMKMEFRYYQILLYNFKDEDRLRQIRRYLNRHRISVRMVQQPEYLESLGFLFEIPGF